MQIHALVARGDTILAEHQAGKRDFSQGMSNIPLASHFRLTMNNVKQLHKRYCPKYLPITAN